MANILRLILRVGISIAAVLVGAILIFLGATQYGTGFSSAVLSFGQIFVGMAIGTGGLVRALHSVLEGDLVDLQ